MRDRSEGQANLEGIDQCGAGIVDTNNTEENTKENDEAIVSDGAPLH